MVCWPDLRECGSWPCSQSMTIPELEEFVNGNPVDLRLLKDYWGNGRDLDYFHDWEARAERVRIALWDLGKTALEDGMSMGDELEKLGRKVNAHGNVEILVITHGGFLGCLMDTEKGMALVYTPPLFQI